MLALFLKAGYRKATEDRLLACLWTLESFGDIWRGPATTVLHDYLQHLHAFCPKRLAQVTAAWPASFSEMKREMTDAQMDLLKRLDWRVRLSHEKELGPCHSLLFQLSPAAHAVLLVHKQQVVGGACGGAAVDALLMQLGPQEGWAVRMNHLVSAVWTQAQRAASADAPDAKAAESSSSGSCTSTTQGATAVAAASARAAGAAAAEAAADGEPSPAKRQRCS